MMVMKACLQNLSRTFETHSFSTPCRYFASFQSQNSWQGLQVRPPVAFATVAVYRAQWSRVAK